jgi:hypothetical protein
MDFEVPPPPGDLAGRDLPSLTLRPGRTLWRLHQAGLAPDHFGAARRNRFDDPRGAFGVCYAALSEAGAFAETLLRRSGATLLTEAILKERALSSATVTQDLTLVRLFGDGLIPLGATAAVTSGPYPASQAWARALHDHPAKPAGVAYRANHDNDELAVALFDRARGALDWGDRLVLDRRDPAAKAILDPLFTRYRVGVLR